MVVVTASTFDVVEAVGEGFVRREFGGGGGRAAEEGAAWVLGELEAASAHAGLDAYEGLHAPHCHLGLLPDLVTSDQGLQPDKPSQSPQGSPGLLIMWLRH